MPPSRVSWVRQTERRKRERRKREREREGRMQYLYRLSYNGMSSSRVYPRYRHVVAATRAQP